MSKLFQRFEILAYWLPEGTKSVNRSLFRSYRYQNQKTHHSDLRKINNDKVKYNIRRKEMKVQEAQASTDIFY